MEENSIIRALYDDMQKDSAQVADLKARIARLEHQLHRANRRLCLLTLKHHLDLAAARAWAAAWKAGAKINRAALRSSCTVFAERLVNRDDELDRLRAEIRQLNGPGLLTSPPEAVTWLRDAVFGEAER